MVAYITTSRAGLQALEAIDTSAIDDVSIPYQDRIDFFLDGGVVDLPWNYTTLTSTLIRADIGTYSLSLSGLNLGPVGSLAALEGAIATAMVTGTFGTITLSETPVPGGPTLDLLSIATTPTGYRISAQDLHLDITGALPRDFAQLYELVDAIETLLSAGPGLPAADRTALLTRLGAFDITGLTLSRGQTELLDLSVSATTLALAIDGHVLTLTGSFFGTLGDLGALYLEAADLNTTDLASLTSLDITGGSLTGPGNQVLLSLSGTDLTTSLQNEDIRVIVDGETFDAVYLGRSNGGVDDFDDFHARLETGPVLMLGGDGDDYLIAGNGNDLVEGGDDNDFMDGWIGDDRILGGNGDDELFGFDGNDTLDGGDGQDFVSGEVGNDLLSGGNGNDEIFGGDGFDTISGGDGNDTVYGDNGRDLVFLNQGNDIFFDNTQGGDLGRDTVFGGFGDDTIEGGNGDDVFHGEWGNDLINARLGNDLVYGGDGFDTISAGEGNDTVYGGNGRDLVFLNQGDDLYVDNAQGGVLGRDTVFGGLGADTIQGGNGDDVFFGDDGNDVIWARLGNDSVYGGANFDFIDTGDGDDLAFGGLGRDRIFLGSGDDRFVDTDQGGDLGQDTITGGAGADSFVFGLQTAADVITDFELGIDTLEITSALAGGRSAAQLEADAQVTDQGVLLDFGGGNSILLEGLTDTAGLAGDILLV